jgi:hypothetical protein
MKYVPLRNRKVWGYNECKLYRIVISADKVIVNNEHFSSKRATKALTKDPGTPWSKKDWDTFLVPE